MTTWFSDFAFLLSTRETVDLVPIIYAQTLGRPGPEGTQLEEAVFKPTPGLNGCHIDIKPSSILISALQPCSISFPVGALQFRNHCSSHVCDVWATGQ